MCVTTTAETMYIANHVFPLDGTIGYRGSNNHNDEYSGMQQQRSNPDWDSSNHTLYEVDVAQYIDGEEAHYEVQLMIFSSTSMTAEDIVRMACNDIIKDTDNKYKAETMSSLNDPPVHDFDRRLYGCLTMREMGNHTGNHFVCACGDMPPISVYGDNTPL